MRYDIIGFIALSDVSPSVKSSSGGEPSLAASHLGRLVAEHVASSEHDPSFSCSVSFPNAADDARIPAWVREQYQTFRPLDAEEQRLFNEGFQVRLPHVRELYARSKQ